MFHNICTCTSSKCQTYIQNPAAISRNSHQHCFFCFWIIKKKTDLKNQKQKQGSHPVFSFVLLFSNPQNIYSTLTSAVSITNNQVSTRNFWKRPPNLVDDEKKDTVLGGFLWRRSSVSLHNCACAWERDCVMCSNMSASCKLQNSMNWQGPCNILVDGFRVCVRNTRITPQTCSTHECPTNMSTNKHTYMCV